MKNIRLIAKTKSKTYPIYFGNNILTRTGSLIQDNLTNVKKIELAKIALEEDINPTINIDPNSQDDHSINNEDGDSDDMEIKVDTDSHGHQGNTPEETKSQDDQINISE